MDKSIVPLNQIAAISSNCYEFSNSYPPEVVEIEDEDTSVRTVEKQMEDLKLDYKFNEKDIPKIFQRLVNKKMSNIEELSLQFTGSIAFLALDSTPTRFEKKTDHWAVTYEQDNTTIETIDPEKSIIDHLWFVLKNPNIKLKKLRIMDCEDSDAEKRQMLNSEKLNILLQSMIDSIDHQIHTNVLDCRGANEDVFLSLLKHVDPEALETIDFNISWKNAGNYQKMEQIVETEQWKQAKTILSSGVTPLEIDNLFHCENFWLELASVTPEDVLRVVEHVFNSSSRKACKLSCEHNNWDIDAIIDFLRSQNNGSLVVKIISHDPKFKFIYRVVKSDKHVFLVGKENYIYTTTE